MARTLAEIQAEIDKLKKEADKIRATEIKAVVARIREAIEHYGLTARDLFGKGAARGQAQAAVGRGKAGMARKGKAGKAKAAAVVRFRDEQGNTWVGRGKRPQWLRDALAAGRPLEDFAVK